MESQEFLENIKKRRKDLDRILAELKMKVESENKFIKEKIDNGNTLEKIYEQIILELKEKILAVEKENKDLRRVLNDVEKGKENIEEAVRKENQTAFYLLNDLKKENLDLREKLKNNTKIIDVDMEDYVQYDILLKNYNVLFEEYKTFKEKNSNNVCLAQNEFDKIQKEYQELFEVNQTLLNEKSKNEKIINDLANEIEELKNQNNNLILINDGYEKNLLQLKYENNQHRTDINRLKNEIIDLKGNIRVFCRIRPNLDNSRYSMILKNNSLTIEKNEFVFDKIFDPEENQISVFNEIVFLIQSVLDGFKVCIFAYGQTGSGKTHTMEGDENNEGVIPRAINEVFSKSAEMQAEGWESKFTASYVEIYNETINDLLSEKELKCEIKHEEDKTYIKNCTYIEIKTKEEAIQLLKIATKNRSIGATKCNDRSSRSHSVFMISVEMKCQNEIRNGILTLIDLAGSERLNESGSEGIRLKETQNINKSLTALGNVMGALIKNENHIPYRNSKLTYLLQNYLSGNSRILMFVNISPELRHLNETLCSLRFAQKVSECKLGATYKNAIKKL